MKDTEKRTRKSAPAAKTATKKPSKSNIKKTVSKSVSKTAKKIVRKKLKKTEPELVTDYEWFRDRMGDLAISNKIAANALGVQYHQIWRMISGQRNLKPDEIGKWAQLLKVSGNTILQKIGVDSPNDSCDIIGTLRSSGRVSLVEDGKTASTMAPVCHMGELAAIRVDAPQSQISQYDGSVFFFERSEMMRADAVGRLSVIEIGESSAPVIGVLDRASLHGSTRIVIIGGIDEVVSEQPISASPIKWIRLG